MKAILKARGRGNTNRKSQTGLSSVFRIGCVSAVRTVLDM